MTSSCKVAQSCAQFSSVTSETVARYRLHHPVKGNLTNHQCHTNPMLLERDIYIYIYISFLSYDSCLLLEVLSICNRNASTKTFREHAVQRCIVRGMHRTGSRSLRHVYLKFTQLLLIVSTLVLIFFLLYVHFKFLSVAILWDKL